jgi:hypothetical protein
MVWCGLLVWIHVSVEKCNAQLRKSYIALLPCCPSSFFLL